MSDEEIEAVRTAVIDQFTRQRFEEAEHMLAEHSRGLPEAVRLECEGTAYFYRRNLRDAIRCFEAAIALEPQHVIARYQYLVGTQEEREGNFVEAFKRYQAAIEAAPEFVDAYVELGGLLTKVDDLKGALRCYRDALRLDASDVGNYHNLVAVLERLVGLNIKEYESELSAAKVAYESAAKIKVGKVAAHHKW